MSTTDNGATITPISDAPSAAKAAAEIAPVRATWKIHGNPASFRYYGNGAKPSELGIEAVVLGTDKQGISLDDADGNPLARFGLATKFWAVVPAKADDEPAGDDGKAEAAKIKADAKIKRDAERAAAKEIRDAAKAERDAKAAARKTEREAKAAAKNKAADERAKAKANKPAIPAGYEVKYPHRTYLLVKIGAAKDDPERIVVMCRQHGTLKPAKNMQDADAIGAKPNRPTWCRGCKTAAAKAAAAN